jgi:hypothetical protein
MTKIKTQYADGSLELETTDTRTLKEQLEGKLTFAQRLEATYPTENVNTSDWNEYDTHKLFK